MTAAIPSGSNGVDEATLIGQIEARKVFKSESLGSALPLTPEEQFIDAVLKWLRAWFDEADATELKGMAPCLFAFADGQEPIDVLPDLEAALSFKSSTDADIAGHVHIGALQMRKIHRKPVAFKDVSSAVSWAHANGLADYTFIVVSPKAREAVILRQGVDPDDCENVPLAPKSTVPFDFKQVPALLNDFHARWTKSHLGYCRVWSKATKRVLKDHPEGQIQGSLMGYFEFTVRPRSVLVDEEFSTFNGRGDVRLVRWSRSKGDPESGMLEVCIMELKVLSLKKSPEKNVEWALAGIQQLLDYRVAKPAPGPSYLCCYDGRKLDEPMPTVEAKANEIGVITKRFFMETPGCEAAA